MSGPTTAPTDHGADALEFPKDVPGVEGLRPNRLLDALGQVPGPLAAAANGVCKAIMGLDHELREKLILRSVAHHDDYADYVYQPHARIALDAAGLSPARIAAITQLSAPQPDAVLMRAVDELLTDGAISRAGLAALEADGIDPVSVMVVVKAYDIILAIVRSLELAPEESVRPVPGIETLAAARRFGALQHAPAAAA